MNLTERRLEFDVHEEHMRKNGYSMSQMQVVDIELGSLQIENCGECPLVTVKCLHTINKWWLLTREATDTDPEVWEKCELMDPRLYRVTEGIPQIETELGLGPHTKLLCEFCGLDVT